MSSLKESLQNLQAPIVANVSPLSLNIDVEPEITVDMDTRTVTVPTELQNIGVVADNNAETVYIRIPSVTFDGIDLTDKTPYIEYINAGKEYNTYKITEIEVEENSIKLGWTIDNNVTRYAGTISFQVSFELNNDYKWSTIPSTMNILNGLDIDSTIPSSESVVVSALFDRVNQVESTIYNNSVTIEELKNTILSMQEQINSLQEDVTYLKNNVVYILDDIE